MDDKEKYLSMLESKDYEMVSLCYAIIKEKYDKGEEKTGVSDS